MYDRAQSRQEFAPGQSGRRDNYNVGWHAGMMLFWGVIIVILAILFTKTMKHNKVVAAKGQTPLEIAKARLAKGEITKEQFVELKKDLA